MKIKSPFYYTILRDPVKRFISHYHFFYYKLGYDNCKGKGLDDLPDKKLNFILNHLGNMQVKFISNIKFVRVLGMKNIMKIAKYNLEHEYGGFGLVEQMDESISKLQETKPDWLNLESSFPQLNKSKSEKSVVSEEVIDKIRKANHYDVEFYSFAKSIF